MYLNFTIFIRTDTFDRDCDRDLNQYKIFVPLFGAAYAAPNKAQHLMQIFSY